MGEQGVGEGMCGIMCGGKCQGSEMKRRPEPPRTCMENTISSSLYTFQTTIINHIKANKNP